MLRKGLEMEVGQGLDRWVAGTEEATGTGRPAQPPWPAMPPGGYALPGARWTESPALTILAS